MFTNQPGFVYKPAIYDNYQCSNFGLSPLLHWLGKTNSVIIYHWNRFSNRVILFKSLNSQHGWIFIMVIKYQYYDWGFQSRFSAMDIILSMGMIYSTMKGIVPSRCRLTTRHLGATLFKLRLHQIHKSHVAASMHHDTWGLMQSHFLLTLLKTRLITL